MSRKKQLLKMIPDATSHRILLVIVLIAVLVILMRLAS